MFILLSTRSFVNLFHINRKNIYQLQSHTPILPDVSDIREKDSIDILS